MDWRLTRQQEEFRQEIRSWLTEVLPRFPMEKDLGAEGEKGGEDIRYSPEFSKELGKKGWIGLAWPKEYGGKALGFLERTIFSEEMSASHAPCGCHFMGERQIGPSLIHFGTEEQKKFYLPRITSGEIGFSIGYTEPNIGSDLAGLTTRAHRDGDDWIVNGQKMWAGGSQFVDYMWAAVRTNPDAPRHKGISVFIIPLKNNPGLTVRPFHSMSFARHNDVFFENVRVPSSAMVGEKDQGWYTIAHNLDFERSGIEETAQGISLWERVAAYCKTGTINGKPLLTDTIVRHKLANAYLELQVSRNLCYRISWMQSKGLVPNCEASVSRNFGPEAIQRACRAYVEILGLYATLEPGSRYAPIGGQVLLKHLDAVSSTIRGGTSEINRNIIATRGLGLPR